jgi:hypothetical protein
VSLFVLQEPLLFLYPSSPFYSDPFPASSSRSKLPLQSLTMNIYLFIVSLLLSALPGQGLPSPSLEEPPSRSLAAVTTTPHKTPNHSSQRFSKFVSDLRSTGQLFHILQAHLRCRDGSGRYAVMRSNISGAGSRERRGVAFSWLDAGRLPRGDIVG